MCEKNFHETTKRICTSHIIHLASCKKHTEIATNLCRIASQRQADDEEKAIILIRCENLNLM